VRLALALALVPGCIPELPDLADPCARWPDPGRFEVKVDEEGDGGTRKPYVYVPAGEGPRPIVVLLHGGGMNGTDIVDVTGFRDLADRQGFVLVYPNGLHWPVRYWNVGPGYGDTDDVGFLDDVVAEVSPKVCGAEVYASGFSNGAMMAQRWACQTSGRVDAVGVSSGPLMVDDCDGPPVPILAYHGKADTVVPWKGGEGEGGHTYVSEEDSMAIWRARNLCTDADPVFSTDGDTTCESWSCAAPTEICLIDGWAHQWPGGVHASQTDADATNAVWAFFQQAAPGTPGL
jgi:polyhydroxybutyrate depolymerase